jgi:hypothetical protein
MVPGDEQLFDAASRLQLAVQPLIHSQKKRLSPLFEE